VVQGSGMVAQGGAGVVRAIYQHDADAANADAAEEHRALARLQHQAETLIEGVRHALETFGRMANRALDIGQSQERALRAATGVLARA
jgi:hypothetical protein